MSSPHRDMAPGLSRSPDWSRAGVNPKAAPTDFDFRKRNRGISFEICGQLAARGAPVILTAKKPELGKVGVKKLAAQKLAAQFHPLDVTATESIVTLRDYS